METAIKNFVADNSRFTYSIKADGTIYINKKGGDWAKIAPDGTYTQPKGASWRSQIAPYIKEQGLELL